MPTLANSTNLKRLRKLPETPACFDSRRDWYEWFRKAVDSGLKKDKPCCDCTLEYQAEMVADGRCEHPDATVGVE